jgi:hypothetical protein
MAGAIIVRAGLGLEYTVDMAADGTTKKGMPCVERSLWAIDSPNHFLSTVVTTLPASHGSTLAVEKTWHTWPRKQDKSSFSSYQDASAKK